MPRYLSGIGMFPRQNDMYSLDMLTAHIFKTGQTEAEIS